MQHVFPVWMNVWDNSDVLLHRGRTSELWGSRFTVKLKGVGIAVFFGNVGKGEAAHEMNLNLVMASCQYMTEYWGLQHEWACWGVIQHGGASFGMGTRNSSPFYPSLPLTHSLPLSELLLSWSFLCKMGVMLSNAVVGICVVISCLLLQEGLGHSLKYYALGEHVEAKLSPFPLGRGRSNHDSECSEVHKDSHTVQSFWHAALSSPCTVGDFRYDEAYAIALWTAI